VSGSVTSGPLAEPALRVDTREELVYLLGQACEIEHGLMGEFLCAQFSLKCGPDEGLTDGRLARVQAWEKALITVIKQEMLHLALATNILTAIGAAPHFERPGFPILSRWYPPGVQIALVRFGERALRHFICLERPGGMALRPRQGGRDDRDHEAAAPAAADHRHPRRCPELLEQPGDGTRHLPPRGGQRGRRRRPIPRQAPWPDHRTTPASKHPASAAAKPQADAAPHWRAAYLVHTKMNAII
jgi:hypothetical protein